MVKGDFHLLVGLLMLLPAAGLLLGCAWVMERLVIREEPAKNHNREETNALQEPDSTLAPPQPRIFVRGMIAGAMAAATTAAGIWLLELKLPALAGLPSAVAVVATLLALILLAALTVLSLIKHLAPAAARLPLATGLAIGCLWRRIGRNNIVVIHATRAVLFKESLPLRPRPAHLPAARSWACGR